MGQRLFVLDVPENAPIAAVARSTPGLAVDRVGPYFAISGDQAVTIDRRATGARHAVWYSFVGGLDGFRIVQWDKDALRVEPR